MPGLKEILLEKLSKVAWYLNDAGLPHRQEPARINFCIHTEMLYDEKVAGSLFAFAKDFYGLTATRMAVCVTTPACPLVREAMGKTGVSEELLGSRVSEIARYAQIGYHGHFYRKGKSGFEQISHGNYDKDTVIAQIRDEMGWLKGRGVYPKVYIGGWWFMTADIVAELERAGILVDSSVRRGKPNTFGSKYLDDEAIPSYGKPFILPPSKNIVEIQSIFGPVMPTSIMNGHLSQFLDKEIDKPLSFVFPLHDWDVPKYHRNLWSNVEALSRSKDSAVWTDILDMRDLFLKERP